MTSIPSFSPVDFMAACRPLFAATPPAISTCLDALCAGRFERMIYQYVHHSLLKTGCKVFYPCLALLNPLRI